MKSAFTGPSSVVRTTLLMDQPLSSATSFEPCFGRDTSTPIARAGFALLRASVEARQSASRTAKLVSAYHDAPVPTPGRPTSVLLRRAVTLDLDVAVTDHGAFAVLPQSEKDEARIYQSASTAVDSSVVKQQFDGGASNHPPRKGDEAHD